MRGLVIFGALLALVGLASWRLYPRYNRQVCRSDDQVDNRIKEVDSQVKEYRYEQNTERMTG